MVETTIAAEQTALTEQSTYPELRVDLCVRHRVGEIGGADVREPIRPPSHVTRFATRCTLPGRNRDTVASG